MEILSSCVAGKPGNVSTRTFSVKKPPKMKIKPQVKPMVTFLNLLSITELQSNSWMLPLHNTKLSNMKSTGAINDEYGNFMENAIRAFSKMGTMPTTNVRINLIERNIIPPLHKLLNSNLR
jgi:hypothetical protein